MALGVHCGAIPPDDHPVHERSVPVAQAIRVSALKGGKRLLDEEPGELAGDLAQELRIHGHDASHGPQDAPTSDEAVPQVD